MENVSSHGCRFAHFRCGHEMRLLVIMMCFSEWTMLEVRSTHRLAASLASHLSVGQHQFEELQLRPKHFLGTSSEEWHN